MYDVIERSDEHSGRDFIVALCGVIERDQIVFSESSAQFEQGAAFYPSGVGDLSDAAVATHVIERPRQGCRLKAGEGVFVEVVLDQNARGLDMNRRVESQAWLCRRRLQHIAFPPWPRRLILR